MINQRNDTKKNEGMRKQRSDKSGIIKQRKKKYVAYSKEGILEQ